MPIIHGTTVGSALKYRLIIAILLMYIIYLRWSHNSTLSLVIEKARKDTGEYQSYAESVAAKLHIIFEHKERLEKIFDLRRLASRGKAKVHERTLRICQESLAMLSGQIDDCKHKNVGQVLLNSQERTELDNLRAQTAVLTSLNDSLNEVILKKEKIIEALSKRISDFQDSLSVCQEAVKKYVGAVPVAHYTQNNTAYFQRKHKASDALAFDRDRDAFEPPKLLPANVLLRKLADKAQHSFRGDETDVHPDDRKNDDNYVNEVPDVNEKDYKENEQL